MQFESASLLGLVGLLYNVLTVGYVNSDQFEVRTVWQSLHIHCHFYQGHHALAIKICCP